MIFCGAQGILSTSFANETGNLAHVIFTHFILSAIVVELTFNATTSGQCISGKSLLAITFRLVISARTLRVPAAQTATIACILALRSTRRINDTNFVNVTVLVSAANKLLRANVVEAVLEIWATRVAAARRLTHSLDAQLVTETVAVGRAHGTANACVANRTTGTLLIITAILDGNTAQQWIASRSWATRTHRLMVLIHTFGILAANIG